MASPTPLYRLTPDNGVYRLQYSWTGWPFNKGAFRETPTRLIAETAPLWKKDGLTVLEYRWLPEHVQILFQATPDLAPTFVAERAKGRFDHALRTDIPLSQKTSMMQYAAQTPSGLVPNGVGDIILPVWALTTGPARFSGKNPVRGER